MNDSEAPVIPEPVRRLWDCVNKALAENDNPSPRDIDRLAASIGLKLAASTIEGWFKTRSVVPAWEKFEVLIKTLGAEQDENWRALHGAALTADRGHKKEKRRRKELADPSTPVPSEPLDFDGEPVPQQLAWDSAPAAMPAERSPEPAPTVFGNAVHTTAGEDGTLARGRFWATPRKVSTAMVLLVLPAVLILVFRPTASGGPAPSAPSGGTAPAAQPPVRSCAYVIAEPARVHPAPNISTKQIKFKHLKDRVEVLDRPHPSGWVTVSTPQDSPGFNWMQTTVLTAPTPCTKPLPGQS
jgi:hypothetical protein